MKTLFAGLLLNIAFASAWLPVRDKRIYNKNGKDIFKREPQKVDKLLNSAYYDPIAKPRQSNSKRWMSAQANDHRVRGVNLGSLFVFEPWLAEDQWSAIGCGGQNSEFDCGLSLGQDGVNSAMQSHWGSFYNQTDFSDMVNLGLNTVRIPVGYWMYENVVDSSSEPFPQGGFSYLQTVCGWASDEGMFIIIDLHGAPGAQVSQNADTGQYASSPGFYDSYNYGRALEFLSWMTTQIHTYDEFRNVGVIEIVNEPVQGDSSLTDSMLQDYYPQAFTNVRNAETAMGVSSASYLNVMMMNELWGSGDPNSYLNDTSYAAYDDHRYIKWAYEQTQTKEAYMQTSCNDNRGGDSPTIVGEWSLSAPLDDSQQWDSDWDPSQNVDWYLGWFSAQARAYEQQDGWIFWTWKAFLGDPRWSYVDAVNAGIIYTDLDDIYSNNACDGY